MSTPEHVEALRGLHAVAADYGILHAELREWAVRNYPGVTSLNDLEPWKLRALAYKIDSPQVATTFRWKYRVAPTPDDLFTQAGWDELHADADQVAERFRR